MRLIFLFCCLFLSQSLIGQGILDVPEIKKIYLDTSLRNGFLLQFNKDPSLLSPGNGSIIYYGKLFAPERQSVGSQFNWMEFHKLLSKNKFKEAIILGELKLNEDPTNFEMLTRLLYCYNASKREEEAVLTISKINFLMTTILYYGDGAGENTTLKVVSVGDEYAMMNTLDLKQITRRSQHKGLSVVDIWKVKDAKGNKKDFFVEVIYQLEPKPKNN